MNRQPLRDALYRKPRLGLTLSLVVLVWCIVLPIAGSVLTWSIAGDTPDDLVRRDLARAWNRGVALGWLTWTTWIMASVRPRLLGIIGIAVVAAASTWWVSQQSSRPLMAWVVDVAGFLVASATANFIVGLPSWGLGRTDGVSERGSGEVMIRRQFSIANVMLITAVVALMIVVARQVTASITPTIYWGVYVAIWMVLPLSSSWMYLGCLRRDGAGQFFFGSISVASVGLLVASLASAKSGYIDPEKLSLETLAYGVLAGGYLLTAAVFAAATCIQSLRFETTAKVTDNR